MQGGARLWLRRLLLCGGRGGPFGWCLFGAVLRGATFDNGKGSEMPAFVYDSPEFQRELAADPHLGGEIRFLTSIAQPGMRVIDAGAHQGITVVALAKQIGDTGHVYAFEPVDEFYNIVRDNLSRNGLNNVSLFHQALGNGTMTILFYKHGGGSGITKVEDAELMRVNTTTVDTFATEQNIEQIDLLSLDCEGSELYVFQGAEAVLAKHSPQIFCEIHHSYLLQLGQSAAQVADYLQRFGYQVEPLLIGSPGTTVDITECSHLYARSSP